MNIGLKYKEKAIGKPGDLLSARRSVSLLQTFVLLSLFIPALLFGQTFRATYPVQATAVLYPPHSLYLSDYSNPSREKIALVLLNRDLTESEVDVRLHLSIRGGNGSLRLETRDYNPLPVFRLPAGVPVRLGGNDLAAYFQSENLTVNGAFSGKMPEGMFEICFSVYEVRTGALVSQTSCARAWITLNRPPLLSLPLDKADFPFREPQQFFFQWTPRHQAISNVEYVFTLKEIHDRNTAVENAFMYSPAVFSQTVSTTNLAYTALDPPLLENTTYAWQVRAVVRDGFEELNLFENNGYSEIRSFSLQPTCYAPTGLSAVQEVTYEKISWTPSDRTAVQVVAYRGKQNGGDWHLIKGNTDYANLFDLSYGTEYEYKAGTVCVDGTIVYGGVRTFIFEDRRKDILENCGVQTEIPTDRSDLLAELSAGDVFRAGDFPVTVTKTEGRNGTFSGAGWTQLPVFMDAKIAVKFTAVQINRDRQLVGGFVETTYDPTDSQITDRDYRPEGDGGTTLTWDLQIDAAIPPGGSITYDPSTGTLVITDANGRPVGNITLPTDVIDKFNGDEPFTYTVKDADGNIYTITKDKDGNVETEKEDGGNESENEDENEDENENEDGNEKEEKEFKLIDLRAVDLSNTNRVAKAGEILYYVDVPTLKNEKRNTKFEVTISPNLNADSIEKDKIQWIYNTTHLTDNDGKTKIEKNIVENDDVNVSVKAGMPSADEKKVDVEWVKEDRTVKDFTTQIEGFFNLFKAVNKISDAAAIVTPCNVNFLKNINGGLTFQWQSYNDEDKVSRHALKHDEFTFSINAPNIASLKCGKRLGVSVFGYDLSLGELYIQFSAGANIGISSDEIYYYENNKFKEKQTQARGGIEAKGEAGITIGGGLKDDKGELIIGAYGGGSVSITGGGRVEYPYNNKTNQMRAVFYIDPLMYNFTAEVKMGSLSKSFTYSEVLWDIKIEEDVIYEFK